jgi:hypothetical protein
VVVALDIGSRILRRNRHTPEETNTEKGNS